MRLQRPALSSFRAWHDGVAPGTALKLQALTRAILRTPRDFMDTNGANRYFQQP